MGNPKTCTVPFNGKRATFKQEKLEGSEEEAIVANRPNMPKCAKGIKLEFAH